MRLQIRTPIPFIRDPYENITSRSKDDWFLIRANNTCDSECQLHLRPKVLDLAPVVNSTGENTAPSTASSGQWSNTNFFTTFIIIFSALGFLVLVISLCTHSSPEKRRRAAAARAGVDPDQPAGNGDIEMQNNTPPRSIHSVSSQGKPMSRREPLSVRAWRSSPPENQLRAMGSPQQAPDSPPSVTLPPPALRDDGRRASNIFGGASRPASPPPTYERRVLDDVVPPVNRSLEPEEEAPAYLRTDRIRFPVARSARDVITEEFRRMDEDGGRGDRK